MSNGFTESVVEDAALDWLHELDDTIAHRCDIAPSEPGAKQVRYGDLLLSDLRSGEISARQAEKVMEVTL